MDQVVEIYIDGACSGNPGPGGWGALLRYDGEEKELSDFEPATTNNRMEVRAAIEALGALKSQKFVVEIYTDSRYLKDGVESWLPKWKRNGWKNAKREPVKNKDLWEELDALCAQFTINWHWVKGHAGHPENEHVDALARVALQRGVMLAGTLGG